MDINELKDQLAKSVRLYEQYEERHQSQIAEEIEALKELVGTLRSSLPIEKINDVEGTLIYVFAESKKKTVSPNVYLCEDGRIRYQVYLKDEYRSYNPTVKYEGSYAVVDPIEMFAKRNGLEFADVVEFFIERIDALPEMAKNLDEETSLRKQYLANFKKVMG